jgi:hypothetical protein
MLIDWNKIDSCGIEPELTFVTDKLMHKFSPSSTYVHSFIKEQPGEMTSYN